MKLWHQPVCGVCFFPLWVTGFVFAMAVGVLVVTVVLQLGAIALLRFPCDVATVLGLDDGALTLGNASLVVAQFGRHLPGYHTVVYILYGLMLALLVVLPLLAALERLWHSLYWEAVCAFVVPLTPLVTPALVTLVCALAIGVAHGIFGSLLDALHWPAQHEHLLSLRRLQHGAVPLLLASSTGFYVRLAMAAALIGSVVGLMGLMALLLALPLTYCSQATQEDCSCDTENKLLY